MRITIERLRIGVLVLAGLLMIAVVVFLGYARYRAHNILHDLPHKLGMQIQQSADGFTYSQSHGGHTLFTLHASKVIQYKDKGRATLHDVSILLYGADGKRADRISGQDFDYDPSSGIAQAQGEVQIDLQGPVKPGQPPAATSASAAPGSGSIRVKTSGLVFNQKTGMATTNENVEFQFPQASGKATGANYDSQKGVLTLDHEVEINSTENGNALAVHASHAQIVRDSHQGFFDKIACTYRGDHVSADHATLLFRDDGSAQQINADGKIHLQTDAGTVIDSRIGVMQMDAHSQPLKAQLSGGVVFHSYDATHKINGNAGEGVMLFGDQGVLHHVTLSNLVSLVDMQVEAPNGSGGTATRQVQSGQLDVDLARDAEAHLEVRSVLAQGDAKTTLRTNPSQGPKQDTTIAADRLLASFAAGSTISTLTGNGHTQITDVAPNGSSQTSTGDTLAVKFAPLAKGGKLSASGASPAHRGASPISGKQVAASAATAVPAGTAEIESAIQQGNVRMEQSATAQTASAAPAPGQTGKSPAAFNATAQKATYSAANHQLRLEGSPRVTDGSLDLTAATLDYDRATGDATANGGVKATYVRTGSSSPGSKTTSGDQGVLTGPGPAHIIAAQATLVHASGDAIFRGQARLWQGSNAIAAPVLELSRSHQTLKAHAETGEARATVNAVLLTSTGTKRQPGLVRIKSQQMLYSDGEREAVFRGGVVADDGMVTIHSDEAEVFLAPPTPLPAGSQQAAGLQKGNPVGSQVDHLIASGHVLLQQPGRKGTGEKLVYTAQEGNFVLTGTGAVRPTLSDAAHGAVTGDSLIFNSRDDSVTVSGGAGGTATQTRAPR